MNRGRHRFEQFTDDLAVWVIFWGPEGGERDRSLARLAADGTD